MRAFRFTIIVPTLALFAAWLALFFRHFLPTAWAERVPPLAIAVLLAVALAASVLRRRDTPRALWIAIVMVTLSFVLFEIDLADDARSQAAWRRESSQRVAETLGEVGRDVARLEDASTTMSKRVAAYVARLEAPLGEDPPAAFALLDSLSRTESRDNSLTAIGFQLFDAGGARVAWAGWPQALSPLDEMFVKSGEEFFYTRSVSLYQILSHVVPLKSSGGERVAALLIDMPLEVDYRVNNRFLKSRSLADRFASAAVARVAFDYYPATGNLPERLRRFQEQREEARAKRERRQSVVHEHPTTPVDAADSSAASAPSSHDSVLTYFAFPDNVEPEGEIAGDASTGLQARVLVRGRAGNPLMSATAVSHPFPHFAAMRGARLDLWAKALALCGLFAMFILASRMLPHRLARRYTFARATLFASFMVLLRYALLSFDSSATRSRLFDPSVFATPTLGGLMRSTFDLALTGLFFVATLYGLVRIARSGAGAEAMRARDGGRPAWSLAVESMLVAGASLAVAEFARWLTNTIVVNANPRLLGETMTLTDVGVITLHVGIFLIVTGVLLAGMFAIWGLFRGMREPRPALVCACALALVGLACVVLGRWEPLMVSTLVLAFVAFAPRIAHREDLVSVGIAAFGLVIVSSGTAYVYLSRDYDELRKGFVLEKSREVNDPADNWKVVILEDVLGDYAKRHEIRQALRSRNALGVERLAFDLWAESPLSLLGYSCAIHVVTPADSAVSEFSVDMPYRARLGEGGERTDTPDQNEWAVLDLTRSTPQGDVRFYRGVLNVDESDLFENQETPRIIGKVIVDVPFFFESLELAARTGPRTPEVLRNVQEGSVAPRVEEPEALLLARVGRDRRVTESSSERLAVGSRISQEAMARAIDQEWPILRAGSRSYRVVILRTADPQQTLLAGFVVPSPGRHLLRWSTLLSLYLFFTLVILVAVLALGAVPRLREKLPTLTPGRRLGFQQKLLASFLVVALVPAVLLGLFSVDFIKERFVEESRDEASVKAFSARKALVNLLHGELQFFLGRSDIDSLIAPGASPVRDLGGGRIVMLLDDAGVAESAPNLAVAGAVEDASTEDLVVAQVGGVDHLGVFSAPLRLTGRGWSGSYYLYYARVVDARLLSEIAEQVGADVNIYTEGKLVASSREGLLAGGFISASMNADAFVELSLLGSDRTLVTERAGSYDFQVAYLPIDRWTTTAGDSATTVALWGRAPTRAALAVPLLFRPESYSLEIQRATSVVLGVFALLLAATIALGLVVARGVFEPLRELVAGTRRISRGDFNVRLRVKRSDEIGLVASAFNEMTERIAESQRALEERRRYLEAILANIGAGVASTDAGGRVRTVNAAAERITGVSAADAADQPAAGLASRSPLFALLRDEAVTAFDSGEIEVEREGKPATVKFMRARLEAEGRYFGTVLVFEDVTELIQSKKLSAWVEMARQIAHEIKNPLTPIRISTQFMRRAYEQRPAEFERVFKEGTETIMHQVEVLKRIASEFSSYGRMQQLDVKPQPVDPLIRRIVQPYEHNTSGVRMMYENGASNARVMADGEAVRKICANLIENAMEAMGSKGGELRVRCAETTNEGVPAIRITFRDTGSGLNEEVARRLFEPYFSTKTTGTGLGLAICRTLSREMGGDVTVENVAGGVEAALTLKKA